MQRHTPGVHNSDSTRSAGYLEAPISLYMVHRLLTCNHRYPGGVDGGERIDVMHWFVKKVWATNPRAPANHSTNRK